MCTGRRYIAEGSSLLSAHHHRPLSSSAHPSKPLPHESFIQLQPKSAIWGQANTSVPLYNISPSPSRPIFQVDKHLVSLPLETEYTSTILFLRSQQCLDVQLKMLLTLHGHRYVPPSVLPTFSLFSSASQRQPTSLKPFSTVNSTHGWLSWALRGRQVPTLQES